MMIDKERFAKLCEELGKARKTDSEGFTTYNEKRLHVILKRLCCEDSSCYEQKVGRFVADVFDGEAIYEIQTASLYPLKKKLDYYLNETKYPVTVIKPFIASKRIVRVDKESGEVLRARRSPKKTGDAELYSELYKISEHLANERLRILILYIEADEYRYSDKVVRYRRTGKRDSELFPRGLISERCFCGMRDYDYLLEGSPDRFSAKEFGKRSGLSRRALYDTLNLLCRLSLLEKKKNADGTYEYTRVYLN